VGSWFQSPIAGIAFPPIQHAIWLYLRFTLSYRDVEDLLAERGLEVSYESVRSWVLKFGPRLRDDFASFVLGRAIAGTSTRWSSALPEGGWRAVDHESEVLHMLVQRQRDKCAALKLMRKLLRKARLCAEGDRGRQAALLCQHLPAAPVDVPA
jgi:putative transposase